MINIGIKPTVHPRFAAMSLNNNIAIKIISKSSILQTVDGIDGIISEKSPRRPPKKYFKSFMLYHEFLGNFMLN